MHARVTVGLRSLPASSCARLPRAMLAAVGSPGLNDTSFAAHLEDVMPEQPIASELSGAAGRLPSSRQRCWPPAPLTARRETSPASRRIIHLASPLPAGRRLDLAAARSPRSSRPPPRELPPDFAFRCEAGGLCGTPESRARGGAAPGPGSLLDGGHWALGDRSLGHPPPDPHV